MCASRVVKPANCLDCCMSRDMPFRAWRCTVQVQLSNWFSLFWIPPPPRWITQAPPNFEFRAKPQQASTIQETLLRHSGVAPASVAQPLARIRLRPSSALPSASGQVGEQLVKLEGVLRNENRLYQPQSSPLSSVPGDSPSDVPRFDLLSFKAAASKGQSQGD
jgi:hypothetical protein